MQHHNVTARVQAEAVGRLRFAIDRVSADMAVASASEPDGEGWVEVVIPTESLDYAHDDLLRLGPDIEVLDPPELRERLASTAKALADRYA
jgi:predicted DNA-binding transcriptional regulator YafY